MVKIDKMLERTWESWSVHCVFSMILSKEPQKVQQKVNIKIKNQQNDSWVFDSWVLESWVLDSCVFDRPVFQLSFCFLFSHPTFFRCLPVRCTDFHLYITGWLCSTAYSCFIAKEEYILWATWLSDVSDSNGEAIGEAVDYIFLLTSILFWQRYSCPYFFLFNYSNSLNLEAFSFRIYFLLLLAVDKQLLARQYLSNS